MRRAQTPNLELSGGAADTSPQRRAVTPGPEWGHHPGLHNSNEDLSGARDIPAHYRQPSYLTAMDTVSGGGGGHARDQFDGFRSRPTAGSEFPPSSLGEDSYSRSHTLPARSSSHCRSQQPGVPQYTQSSTQGYTTTTQSHFQRYPNQYPHSGVGYNSPQHQRPASAQSYTAQGHSAHNNVNIPSNAQHQGNSNIPSSQPPPRPPMPRQNSIDVASDAGYDDWTLSTSEQYRRQGPVSPRKEKADFSFPNSPQRVAQQPVGKMNEVQRMDSFTKENNGADVIRSHRGRIHEEYPLEHMQRNRRNSQDDVLRVIPRGDASKPQSTDFQKAMKRARSLENTAEASAPPPAVRPATSVTRGRPASARPYDFGHQKPVVSQQPQQPQRSASTQPDRQPPTVYPDPEYMTHEELMRQNRASSRLSSGLDALDGQQKLSKVPSGKSGSSEDNYATFNMRKQTESILHLQNRMRPKVPHGAALPPSSQHNTSSSSIDTMPASFRDALQVDIPADNISIGSNMSKSDSGYRSGDRASNSSASSGVDSPLPDGPGVHGQRQYGKAAFVYGSYDPKVHSSNDSLDSAQSGQSCATLTNKSTGGQPLGNIPEAAVPKLVPHAKETAPVPPAYVVAQQGMRVSQCREFYHKS